MSAAEFAPLRAYDGIRLIGPSQGVRCAQTEVLFAICPLCGARSKHTRLRPKFFKFPRGLREHLNSAHDDLPTAERARLLVDAGSSAISDCDAHLRALAADAASAASAASSSHRTEADTPTLTPMRVPASATPSAPQMSVQTIATLHPCLVAARDGNLDALRAWSIVEVNSVFDRHGSSALHWAAGGGHLDIVRYLIEGDARDAASASDAALADPCMRAARSRLARDDGKTPLHWAARNGHVAVIEYLLGLGVPIDIPMNDQSSALDLAVFGGHLAAVSLLAHRQDAAAASSADAMGRNQSDWRSRRNDHQCTVAHWAGMGGSVTVIAWLLRHGCRFDAVQKENQSPLHKAAGKKNFNALAAIATALLLPLAAASRVGGSDEAVLLLDRIRAAIGGSTGVVEDGGSPRTLELAACPACEADAAAPGRISLADLPCGVSAESMIDETRQLFALRDTSGLCARDVALAQGMSADHAAFAILSVFDL